MKLKTIEIVGGGIAGLSLAVGLRKAEVPVVLHEAGSYPRHRLCGEFVNGVSAETLAALGLESLFEGARSHEEMTWWLKEKQIARATLAKPVAALSRWEMDRRMSALFQEMGGDLRCRSRGASVPREGLVWAAGRKIQKESEWLGLKAHFLDLETCSGLEMHLGEEGYAGLTPVEDGRVNVCGLFRRRDGMEGKGSERFLAQLEASGLGGLAERLRGAVADESSVTGISGIGFGGQGHAKELLTLGDAERMIPPFTGNGMSMAFEAAESALESLCRYARGDSDWAGTRARIQSRLESRFRRRITLAKGMHGLILKSPGQEALSALAKPGLLPFAFLTRLLT